MASVVIDIASEFTGKKAFKQAETATDKLSKSVKSLAKTFGLTFGTAAVIGYAKASVKAAAADQKAQQQLALALKNVGLERDAASAESFIQRLQTEFGVVDDLLRPAYQKLAVATRNTAETQKLLSIALDISASTGKDLDSVTGALSKAYLGNNTALGKLGVGISKADLKSKSFKDITDDLAVTFKGSAKAASETYAGSIAKLGVAAANVQEIIGTGLIDALKNLGNDKTVANLAIFMQNLATYTADVIRGFGLMAAALKNIPGLSGLTGASIVQAIPILGSYLTLLNKAGAQSRRAAEVAAQKNPIQSGSYLSTAKKVTTLVRAQADAQAKILAAKKLTLAIDKANTVLGKSEDIFNMDKIQIGAALIGQAEALGKATTGSQVLAIANDVQRLRVKESISALEDAIATKDEAAIKKATAKLNEDIKILGALQNQEAKLVDINKILAGMKSTDLINLSNLNTALDLLKKFVFPTPNTSAAAVAGTTYNPTQALDLNYDLKNPLAVFVTNMPATTGNATIPGAGTIYNPSQNPDRNYDNYVITINAGVIADPNSFVDIVQNALNEIARRGYLTTYAGALPA